MHSFPNLARERLERGELSIGVGIRLARTVEIAKAMRTAGFDWLFLDLEHSSLTLDATSQIAIAALGSGIAPLARVPKGEYSMATRLLDNGVVGIVMPHIDNADEAREVVSRLKYPPRGHRSISSSVPQFDYRPMKTADLVDATDSSALTIVMLESPEAIDNAEEIAAVAGIDVLLIGTSDLSIELGIPGEYRSPLIRDAYARTVSACNRHGKWAGMAGIYDEAVMPLYIDMGVRFILAGGEFSFMMAGATSRVKFLRGLPLVEI